jgi:hypothetical protein
MAVVLPSVSTDGFQREKNGFSHIRFVPRAAPVFTRYMAKARLTERLNPSVETDGNTNRYRNEPLSRH